MSASIFFAVAGLFGSTPQSHFAQGFRLAQLVGLFKFKYIARLDRMRPDWVGFGERAGKASGS